MLFRTPPASLDHVAFIPKENDVNSLSKPKGLEACTHALFDRVTSSDLSLRCALRNLPSDGMRKIQWNLQNTRTNSCRATELLVIKSVVILWKAVQSEALSDCLLDFDVSWRQSLWLSPHSQRPVRIWWMLAAAATAAALHAAPLLSRGCRAWTVKSCTSFV
ncbi:neurocalcin-delta isoform X3 [Felis catus]|uniref:neurocalcin-delta isoform X3 n=1 Tax=Felis catus TaxID=9685 RepID=UPI001D1A3201|nr:neurocalcin-delta isoform X3 [Felis catus]